jgi:hypothetical protein
LLAWLLPGAGHFYQRRYGKGGLLMACILGTFFFGLYLGEGRVVYASWREQDVRYVYLCQVCVGAPALPALVQAMRMKADPPKAPLWSGLMAPPILPGQIVTAGQITSPGDFEPLDGEGRFVRAARNYDQLSEWQNRLGAYFEIGTLYTVVAGLLNVLAIYDAVCGPMPTHPRGRPRPEPAL